VARALGIEAPAFDVNSACTSFWVGLHVLSGLRPEHLPDFVLLVAVDSLTKVVDYADRSAAVLWGDGAAAALLSPRVPGPAQVLGTHVASAPSDADRVRVLRESHFVQEGRQVQIFAIRRSAEGYAALRQSFEDDARALHFVGHQANLRVLEATCARCGIAPERHHANVELFGNTGSAGAASVVSMGWEKWRPGDDVALVGVGAGLTWARALLRFGGV
jgi:3-oxoacyl-[acyl-carrier-protein] synthase-3